MSKHRARTLSCTFAPALVALVGLTAGRAWATDPADIPARPAEEAGVEKPHTKSAERKGYASHRHHGKHHHKKHHHEEAGKDAAKPGT